MAGKMKVIVPKHLVDTPQLKEALQNAKRGAALAAKADFGVTTQTWQHQPEIKVEESTESVKVFIEDQRYTWINDGTNPYTIVPRNAKLLRFTVPFKAKTVPGAIRSRKGSRGRNVVFARRVNHPGITARKFDEVIQKKWLKEFPDIVQRAIDSIE